MSTIWDVVVVGAGPSGILATEQLRSEGLRVLLLEAGGRHRGRGNFTPADDSRWRYQTVGGRCEWLRAHGVGGSTLLWGGWTNRFPEAVFRRGRWPYSARTLAPDYARAEQWLGVVDGTLAPRYERAASRLDLPFVPRRGAKLGRATWTARCRPAARTARTHTTAVGFDVAGDRAQALDVVDAHGNTSTIAARAFVLAASPIETCRLLLCSGVDHPALGRGLVDHIVVSYVLVEPHGERLGKKRGPFTGSAFVPRFVNINDNEERGYSGGFSIEAVGPWPLRGLGPEALAALGVRPTRGAKHTFISGMGELSAHPDRYVDLAPRARDCVGRRISRVHLAYADEDRRLVADMSRACISVAEAIAVEGAELIACEDPFESPRIFHPAGTCAMGVDDSAPCDPWGRVRSLRNVFVADASVLPTAGDCHPTLTILAHAFRMTRALTRSLH